MFPMMLLNNLAMARRNDAGSSPGCGCFVAIAIIGIVVYLVMKSRRDRQGTVQAPQSPSPSSGGTHTFGCPYPKCPNCAANADKMKQQWDGMRKVTWTCGYCGAVQVQELRDEEIPQSARQGFDAQGQPYYPPQGGGMGGVGGLLTGMMIGNMLGGSDHHNHHDGDNSGGGWGSSGGGDSTGGDSGWGDSGGDDWGGGDDSGGDSGGDFGD